MNRKELRHDRHTVSLLTNHMVFAEIQGEDAGWRCGDDMRRYYL
jgi:hypothetical protein